MSKRQIMKETGCSEELYNKARKHWAIENALECMLLGQRFEQLSHKSLDKYFAMAAAEINKQIKTKE